jgi:hypothetical protein
VNTDDILHELKRVAFFDVRNLWDPVTRQVFQHPLDMQEEDARVLVNFDIIVLTGSAAT